MKPIVFTDEDGKQHINRVSVLHPSEFGLLDDLYTVIDVENKLGGNVEECVGGYDLIYNNGPVKTDKQSCYSTRLGCFDDRVRQLKKLHKAHAKRQLNGS